MAAVDAITKKVLWQSQVDGVPYGLAAANGRLYVSTDRGTLYCFAAAAKPIANASQHTAPGRIGTPPWANPPPCLRPSRGDL